MAHRLTVKIDINHIFNADEVSKLLSGIPLREWQALRQVVLDEVETLTQTVTDPKPTNVSHSAGGLDSLRNLLARLAVYRSDGEKTPDEEQL